MVVSLLEMQIPCSCFTLSLCAAVVVEEIVGETTMMLRWRSRCRAGDDGNNDSASEMEITSTR